MSLICDFYDGYEPNTEGLYLFQIQDEDDDWLEFYHAWVQWLFPLKEPSNFNPDAPLLTDEDIKLFKTNTRLQANLRDSFLRFLRFLGLEWEGEEIRKGPKFQQRMLFCWGSINHNWLRITRCLTSLRLLGCNLEAGLFYKCLENLYKEGLVSHNSFGYWREAMI